ncbi:hypothetical protein PQ465_08550 [Sphingobacterium oryzagri]|uniref:Phage abortive infection protein n=1 Tax=Sphingobacterium oryzagri TaxID=3025669 RepID=A0ABY7WLE3_9SPHI|nr:hypothetical protein [Sphingobacterium sp. KACC 22765]WDF70412.1 hypothetical protein PQ465_08550 [Sphingobacterium sp. KACC 22765]
MKTNTPKSKKLYWNICMTGSIIITVIVAGYFGLYRYWKLNVDQENGYNSIDSLIGAIGIPINILTIIFVAVTYRQQSKQIKEQRQQLEFTRVADLVYRQFDITENRRKHLFEHKEFLFEKVKTYRTLSDTLEVTDDIGMIKLLADKISEMHRTTKVFIKAVHQAISFYQKIINSPSLAESDVNLLKTIVNDGFYTQVLNNIEYVDGSLLSVQSHNDRLQRFYEAVLGDNGYKSVHNIIEQSNKLSGEIRELYTLFKESK